MSFDNPTLYSMLLVQAVSAAFVLILLTGPRASRAVRWAQACMGLQGLGWLLITHAGPGQGWLGSLALLAFSASLSCLSWALGLWLQTASRTAFHRGSHLLMCVAPLLMPLVYGLYFEHAAFRLAWAHAWLALQCLLLVLALTRSGPPPPLHPDLRKSLTNTAPAADNRRWRLLLLAALLPMGVICLLRSGLAGFGLLDLSTPGMANVLAPGVANTGLGLSVQWSLGLTLLGLVLAWRGELEAELARLAQTDGLTGLNDARAFAARSVEMISMSRRHQEPLALMLLDLDHLKAINTEHGMEAGDRALALFGSCVQAQMRLGDLAGRVGAEEFGVLMARCEAQGPQALDQRLRQALALRAPKELGFTLDFSAGWSKLRHGDRDIEDLKRRAETALYEAKRGGRSRLQAEPGLEA